MLNKYHNIRLKFYHGTSSILPIKKYILPPVYTQNKREHWRKKYIDKVFFTDSILSAYKFAQKACDKYGGTPIVYEVKPVGQWFNTINTEYIADKALVIRKLDK
ncbi:MAG: hypothetical protein IJQ28_03500 [Clostridia bacterium]|nr:hypothetical protein [Clostridia bacterium]